MTHRLTFHLIPNAHLDPVWLWDWREGLNEGLITCRTVLDLMDEDPDLTFIRGESAIYEHIERTDPATFGRIKRYVEQGRWEPVGGTYIQPDTNLPHAETFARHYCTGIRYFGEKFGKRVRVAWAADSFGHAAGIPGILAAAGVHGIAFCRPDNSVVPIEKPAFWWRSASGSRVLAYRPPVGWYGAERHEMPQRLDALLADARKNDLRNVGVFFGLGNHGGGPTRRQIADVRAWAYAHPEVDVAFSTLHQLIDSLYVEVKEHGDDLLPTHVGELNFVLRGCYSSLAKFKFAYRHAENHLLRAERTDAAISAFLGRTPADLSSAWRSVLFNSFHDILPGSSIERAFDDQLAWLGGALHDTQRVELSSLNALAARIDTRVAPVAGDMPAGVPMLVFNPHPYEYRGVIELEASLDYRPIWKYHNNVDALPVRVTAPDGTIVPHQITRNEHSCMVPLAWRKRAILPVTLPAMGYSVFEIAYVEGAKSLKFANPVIAKAPSKSSRGPHVISNGIFTVRAKPGDKGVTVLRKGKPFLSGPLTAVTVEDPWGSWGAMDEDPASLCCSTVRHQWKVTQVELLEVGPLRAMLWVRLEGGGSRLELACSVTRGRDAVDVSARVMWDERSARLKLVMPLAGKGAELLAEYEVPGATVTRRPSGEVPGGRWVRVRLPGGKTFGFASDSLYNFDQDGGALRATVCRATRYANDVRTAADVEPWRPAVDAGELKFRFLLAAGGKELGRLAAELEQSVLALPVAAHPGPFPRSGALLSLFPESVQVMALKPAADGDGYVLRVRETGSRSVTPALTLAGRAVKLRATRPGAIQTYRLTRAGVHWKATLTNIPEEE